MVVHMVRRVQVVTGGLVCWPYTVRSPLISFTPVRQTRHLVAFFALSLLNLVIRVTLVVSRRLHAHRETVGQS